jgi:polar amino acid transport system substrate-binding protein
MPRLRMVLRILLFLAALGAVCALPGASSAQPESLRVATRIVRPFVFEEGGNLTGFSIELWEEIAVLIGARTEYVTLPTVQDLLNATRGREVDLAISAISITEEREREWDLSQPMFDAGLQILAPARGGGSSLASILGAVFSPAFLTVSLIMAFGTLLAGHIVWFFEANREDGVFRGRRYFPTIFEAIFWAVSTLATQAEMWPKSAIARVVSTFWMFAALLFVAYFTATVTSALTVQQLRTDIQGPDDLPGKRVATVRGSTSAQYLGQRSITASDFTTIDEALAALERGEGDAVVYDAPVLQYYASHEGKGKVTVVGPVFRKEDYGILFPNESPLRKRVNEALLRLRANGTYDRLLTKWFGGEGGKAAS